MFVKCAIDTFNALTIFVLFSLLVYFSFTLPFLIQSNSIGFKAHHWIIRSEVTSEPSYSIGFETGEVRYQKPVTDVFWDRPSSVGLWTYYVLHVVWNRFVPTIYFFFAFLIVAMKKGLEGVPRFLVSVILYFVLILIIPWVANHFWPPLVAYNVSTLSVVIPNGDGWVLKDPMPEGYATASRFLLWFLLLVQTLYAAIVTLMYYQEDQ